MTLWRKSPLQKPKLRKKSEKEFFQRRKNRFPGRVSGFFYAEMGTERGVGGIIISRKRSAFNGFPEDLSCFIQDFGISQDHKSIVKFQFGSAVGDYKAVTAADEEDQGTRG